MNLSKWVVILIFLILIIFILGFFTGRYFINENLTGKSVADITNKSYSWTTAICNTENKCIDVLIECENGKVKNISPMSDLIEFKGYWEDPRINGVTYCE
ncbi:MAG: hypothetical protein AABX07_00775 [Nanoarchaeota archaeon]